LFNVLSARLELAGMAVLDLYAGSGALGLEALSRGAASVTFVESDHGAAEVISRNIAAVGLPGATLRRGSVASVLVAGTSSPVELVLADPPYDVAAAETDALPALLTGGGWAGTGTVVVIERAAAGSSVSWPDGWVRWRSRRYGDTRLELDELG
jgi:16S rRNA (guanine(966)-N(2))-methyltransferase RsmD